MLSDSPASARPTPGRENYLRVLLSLSGGQAVRSRAIAEALSVTRASVSSMLKRLRAEGYVRQQKYGAVTLTEKGRQTAADVTRRCDLLYTFFTRFLGVDAATAARDARQLSHCLSAESRRKLEAHMHSTPLRKQEIGKEIS